jgi:hypothetical protein
LEKKWVLLNEAAEFSRASWLGNGKRGVSTVNQTAVRTISPFIYRLERYEGTK